MFGCQDGFIYVLSTADGRLVWKFIGAPGDRSAMLNSRPTSAFPALGSVLICHNRVYAAVGYHAYVDGVAF